MPRSRDALSTMMIAYPHQMLKNPPNFATVLALSQLHHRVGPLPWPPFLF